MKKKENQLVYFDHQNENSLCHRYNNSLRICFGLFSKSICMASMYQEHFTCTNFVQTFGECSVFCSVSFFFKCNYQKLSGTYHHFFRNQDDCSGDQNLHIRCKEHVYINYSRPGQEIGLVSNLHITAYKVKEYTKLPD